MIDLHLHYDGSLTESSMRTAAGLPAFGLSPEQQNALLGKVSVPHDCRDLNEYLACFELPLRILQRPEVIEATMADLVRSLFSDGILYCELRFAPVSLTGLGMTQEEAVRAAIDGMNRGLAEAKRVMTAGFLPTAQVMLCCMRGYSEEGNRETLRLTEKYLGQGVCGIDLAGAEALFPLAGYSSLFEEAVKRQIPVTLHAGEAGPSSEVIRACKAGALRIGHGVSAFKDQEAIRVLKESGVTVECCPTSNLQTRAVDCIENHPARGFLSAGIPVCICTDNRTVSNTSLRNEFALLQSAGMTKEEYRSFLVNAARAAFLPPVQRQTLEQAVLAVLERGDDFQC